MRDMLRVVHQEFARLSSETIPSGGLRRTHFQRDQIDERGKSTTRQITDTVEPFIHKFPSSTALRRRHDK